MQTYSYSHYVELDAETDTLVISTVDPVFGLPGTAGPVGRQRSNWPTRLTWIVASVIIALGTVFLVIGTDAVASGPTTAQINRAAAHLRTRPALILPGQWQSPSGIVLVRECFASYPLHKARVELFSCLTQPDQRHRDRRVMTLHHYHVLHLQHVAHTNR